MNSRVVQTMNKIRRYIHYKPSTGVSWTTGIVLFIVWALIRLVYFDQIFFPLTYILPLMICIWTRRKKLLWTMAFAFAFLSTLEFALVMPASALPEGRLLYALSSTIINIVAGAATVHLVILLLNYLERSLTELSETNHKIREQKEEIMRHRDHLDELVGERTVELELRNRQLEEEMSERKRTQEEKERLKAKLAQTQKMEAIGSLAGGIAHDLKNILTPILINTEIALEDLGNHSARQALEEALDAAKLGRDLVQQILTFSRQGPKKKVPVNVPKVIRDTLGFLRSTLPSTIDIHDEIEDKCIVAYADPTQIKQVLINLGTNAGHAMRDQGGILEVTESKKILDEDEAARISPELAPGPYIQVEVQDTGQGMDEQTMEHIFEPFFTTKKGEGTGMGLAVVHGIVKEHQGAITVRSRPGEGSLFTVLLPILQDDSEDEFCASMLGEK